MSNPVTSMATPDDIVAAYKFILKREPDRDGLLGYSDLASRGGLTFDRLVHELLTSEEYRSLTEAQNTEIEIRRCFLVVYGRNATPHEIAHVREVAKRIRANGHRGLLRATVAAFDRSAYPTCVPFASPRKISWRPRLPAQPRS